MKLTVPFAEQAPHRIWDADHEEFCEEASALMVGRYFRDDKGDRGDRVDTVGTADEVDAALFELKRWEEEHLSTWVSTTAAETARMVREVYGLNVEILELTEQQEETKETELTEKTGGSAPSSVSTLSSQSSLVLKRALADGKLVIVPAAGQKLGNPHFTPPGPRYHMLVLTGYTADNQFITNDPGIWQGKDWQYSTDVLINAIGDWNGGSPETGAKVVLIISRQS